MIDVNDLRKGVIFEYDGSLYRVLEYTHHKPGRGNAIIRIKMRNIRTGSSIEKTFNSGERVQDIRLDYHNVQYLYNDGDMYYFMDAETFEQPAVSGSLVGEYAGFLKEGMEVKLTFYQSEALDIELPTSVDLKVIKAEAAVRGRVDLEDVEAEGVKAVRRDLAQHAAILEAAAGVAGAAGQPRRVVADIGIRVAAAVHALGEVARALQPR